MEALIVMAMLWINANGPEELHYDPSDGVPLVRYISGDDLAKLVYQHHYYGMSATSKRRAARGIAAAHMPYAKELWFRADAFPSMPTIIHETVHWIQSQKMIVDDYPCLAAGEKPAYDLQLKYERMHGHPGSTDRLSYFLVTTCDLR